MRCIRCGRLIVELLSEPGTWMHVLSWRRLCIDEKNVATPEQEDLPEDLPLHLLKE